MNSGGPGRPYAPNTFSFVRVAVLKRASNTAFLLSGVTPSDVAVASTEGVSSPEPERTSMLSLSEPEPLLESAARRRLPTNFFAAVAALETAALAFSVSQRVRVEVRGPLSSEEAEEGGRDGDAIEGS